MQNYHIHLFDWDGTLTDSVSIWMDIIRSQTQKLGLQLTDAQIHEATGDWHLLAKHGFDLKDLPSFSDRARALARERLPKAPLHPGAKETIQHLKQTGRKLGIVTAAHRTVIDQILPLHGFEQTFDVVISGSDVTKLKPDPEGVLLALKHLGHSAETLAIMWGDADRDLLAAERAKIHSGLFFPPEHAQYAPKETITKGSNPVMVISSWQELLGHLKGVSAPQ